MQITAKYIAGFFDAEGHVILIRRTKEKRGYKYESLTPTISISQKNPEILKKIVIYLNNNGTGAYICKGTNDCYTLYCCGVKRVNTFCNLIKEYTFVKFRELDLLHTYCKNRLNSELKNYTISDSDRGIAMEIKTIKYKERVLPNNNLTNEYICGFFDGDGCIGLFKEKSTNRMKNGFRYSCEVSFAQKDIHILKKIQQYLNNLGITCSISSFNTAHRLKIGGNKNCKNFLNNVLTFSIEKNNKINLMLEFINIRNSKTVRKEYDYLEESIYNKFKETL